MAFEVGRIGDVEPGLEISRRIVGREAEAAESGDGALGQPTSPRFARDVVVKAGRRLAEQPRAGVENALHVVVRERREIDDQKPVLRVGSIESPVDLLQTVATGQRYCARRSL